MRGGFLNFCNVLRVGINQAHSDLRQGLHLLVLLNMVFPSLTMAKVMVSRSVYVATLYVSDIRALSPVYVFFCVTPSDNIRLLWFS